MIIGIPKEVKNNEYRVSLIPAGAKSLVSHGHTVLIEKGAGRGCGISDNEFKKAGARIVSSAKEVFGRAEMIIKVKEPMPKEFSLLRPDLILFTFLHLAPLPELTDALLQQKVIGIGFETVQPDDGSLPLLAPMSEVAGRMAVQIGAHYLEKNNGGRGVLLGGITGVEKGHVLILGSGSVGSNAAQMAVGLGASVTVLGKSRAHLAHLENSLHSRINTLISNEHNIEEELKKADLVVGAVLIPGAQAPKLITRKMLSIMKKGAVLVDVSIDQGGCAETSKPTTHSDPVYEVDSVLHYCVANMPGAVPRTSTFALASVTLPFALEIADKGVERALTENRALQRGVNVYKGKLVNKDVAAAQGKKFAEFPKSHKVPLDNLF